MCGIFGCILASGVPPGCLASIANDSLTALQHRGTESSGLVGTSGKDNDHFDMVRGKGLVRDVFNEDVLKSTFNESIAILGHNRYSTAGMKDAINCVQPFVVHAVVGRVAIAHNGELVNVASKRSEILKRGVGLSTDTDSELIAQIISKAIADHVRSDNSELGDISKELETVMEEVDISYSLLVMTYDRIYAIRDRYGNRPLCIGTLRPGANALKNAQNGSGQSAPFGYIVASESCALPSFAKFDREVRPGEIVEITRTGIKERYRSARLPTPAFCIFEYVYFARSDSLFEGQQVHRVRRECGMRLAKEAHIDADIVSTVPDSATAASHGYAQKSGIPYEDVLYRNSYVGRSFIQPNTELRQSSITKKFGVLTQNVSGKRVVLVDDSIVRGNTMGIIVRLLKQHGAKEVHIRVASPPIVHPCFMGINIPDTKDLIAVNKSLEDIAAEFGADSVQYLSVQGLKESVQRGIEASKYPQVGHCMACLTGEYPVDPYDF
uniref:Amidophosphoribosyltransferase n=1 Tax=Plectus sambesii TaxID=2011161 RepID=A0A914XIX5_9BILA